MTLPPPICRNHLNAETSTKKNKRKYRTTEDMYYITVTTPPEHHQAGQKSDTLPASVAAQGEHLLRDAVLGDDLDGHGVAGVDVALAGRGEHVLDDADRLPHGQRLRLHVLLVLVVDLVVQQWLD